MARLDPADLREHYKKLSLDGADALVLSACVQMPSLPSIQPVEDELGLPVLSAATVLDNDGTPLINGDMMDGIDLVSSNPETVQWKIKPGVTWSDGQPWNCKDFYLAYLAGSGKIPGFTAASSFSPIVQAG